MENPSFGLVILVLGCAALDCSSQGMEYLNPRVSQYQIRDLAAPGVPLQTIIDEFGEPHQRKPNQQGGETVLYRTFIDNDKFIAHRLFWIETDQTGRIVKTTTDIDSD